jgi:hypothetical protein
MTNCCHIAFTCCTFIASEIDKTIAILSIFCHYPFIFFFSFVLCLFVKSQTSRPLKWQPITTTRDASNTYLVGWPLKWWLNPTLNEIYLLFVAKFQLI